ncbi:MAG TPA: VapC toxin family PIN domain ribonuclease [Vicinamibacteria bacterium]|nr:VapC toxin family PIN domain ribonuclease [Vicinamibacteria bacterium]
MSLVLDTGPILAVLDADDPAHARCVDVLEEIQEPLIVVAATLVEIDYWIRKRLQAEVWSIFLADIAEGAYRLEQLSIAEMRRVADLQAEYRDLDLGMVDAAVMVTCEKLGEQKVATLDQRHFGAVRPRHADHFLILPA